MRGEAVRWRDRARRGVVAAVLVLAAIVPGATTQGLSSRDRAVRGALAQVGVTVTYDPSYVKLAYPGGDVPVDRGVCTDVVIRALRAAGVDLQQLVHEDMTRAFSRYPKQWGLRRPDRNIDHRRVANLMTFLRRQGKELALTPAAGDYLPGDLVAFRLSTGQLHIAIVSDRAVPGTDRPLLVHNIGAGARLEDILFGFERIGHYRWFSR